MSKAAVLEPTVAKPRKVAMDKWWEKTVAPPKAHNKILQQINFSLGSFDDEKRTFRAIASTPFQDRQGDVIEQAGWDLEHFKNNPVIPWAHDYFQPPVGRAIEIGVVDGVLEFTYQAPPKGMYEFADLIWDYYRNQFLFAFSVGFLPKDGDGDWERGYTYTECELLEISSVVVPANPQALALSMKMGVMNEKQAKLMISKMESAIKGLQEIIKTEQPVDDPKEDEPSKEHEVVDDKQPEQLSASAVEQIVERAIEKAMSKQVETIQKGAISSSLPVNDDKGAAWDSSAAVKAVKAWASDEDGNIDFKKYRKAFLWVDSENADKQGGYKLPFANVYDGELKAVFKALAAVVAVLNGGRGGVDIPDEDKKSVYAVVKKYYKKFGEDAPELKGAEASTKGAVADELAIEEDREDKWKVMEEVCEIYYAFCDVFYDEDTPTSDFNTLLREMIGLLSKVADGGNVDEPDSDDEDDYDTSHPLFSRLRNADKSDVKQFTKLFSPKSLTDYQTKTDNKDMNKDAGEGSGSGGALTPTESAHVKAAHDYLKELTDTLSAHAEALGQHAKTMKMHSDLVDAKTDGLKPHIDHLKALLDRGTATNEPDADDKVRNDSEPKPNDGLDAPVDGKSEKSVEQPKSESLSEGKDKVEAKDASAEVKSDKTDGAEHKDEKAKEEPEKPAEADITDDTEVDPENLTDEQVKHLIDWANDKKS